MSKWTGLARHWYRGAEKRSRHVEQHVADTSASTAPSSQIKVAKEIAMQFILMAYVQEAGWPAMTKEQQEQGLAAYKSFSDALKKAGAYISSNRLAMSSNATTLRQADGKMQVLDGPFADSKEQLGGYYLIEAKNLDEAIAWGSRCPATGHGAVEVRPIMEMPAQASA
jgi:hypothetical protein